MQILNSTATDFVKGFAAINRPRFKEFFTSILNSFNMAKTFASSSHPVTLVTGNKNSGFAPKRKISWNDVPLNAKLKEAGVSFGFMLLVPIAMLFIDKHLNIYNVPVVIYLFITGITRFCILKYVWRRLIKHEGAIKSLPYGHDIGYPYENAD